MRILLTGGTGFIGGRVAKQLRERGDDVVALVRSPAKAAALRSLGCELVTGDLADTEVVTRNAADCEAAIHGAAVYRVGIKPSERKAMYESNVSGTQHVLDACQSANVARVVYLSTVGVYGNTNGQIVDEDYVRPAGEWLSYYDETKYLAHQLVLERIRSGAPIMIAQPCAVYGTGDTSDIGTTIAQAASGKLPARPFPELGLNFVHVDDVAAGILLALDKGRLGESYILGGEITTMGAVIDRAAAITSRSAPRRTVPIGLLKALAPVGPLVGPLLGLPPNLREVLRASHGVTYWGTSAKAERELGYTARDLDSGLRDTLLNNAKG